MKPGSQKKLRVVLGTGVLLLLAGFIFIRWGNSIAVAIENGKPSRSIGTTKDGRLINGKRLPTCGPNFAAYGYLPVALGRNSLNDRARTVVLDAYAMLERSHPSAHFLYGECSWPSGGRLRPHATHRNGLSIDFFVPVRKSGEPAVIQTSIFNKCGYSLEFDQNGYCSAQDCSLDAETMAAHLLALYQAAEDRGMRIRRVIFAPELQPLLLHTQLGPDVEKVVSFSKDRPWVRHDEHYHVDFENPDETQTGQQPAGGD
jgi:penicillin-insensitive murein endopeptidase